MPRRTFISLQGVASPFFSELNQQLRAAGHRTHRINFCGGDLLFSWAEPHSNYTGSLDELPAWLMPKLKQWGATDLLLFGDCRGIHRSAIAVARQLRLRIHVFEEGYLRPDWITLEEDGVNGYSHMSLAPADILAWAKQRPAGPATASPPGATGSHLPIRGLYDIAYRLANTACCWLFPKYQTHRPHNGILEYAGLARRFGLNGWFAREARAVTKQLMACKTHYFLFPLQLNADSQIRTHSPFPDVIAAIETVLTSFHKTDFPPGLGQMTLLIKNHPLDTGLAGYRRYVERRTRELRLEARVQFIEAGDLPLLLRHAQGVVLVNSTVGLSALALNRPVYALGEAIYRQPGLTATGSLDSFWRHPQAPDPGFVTAFLAYIQAHSQIAGDFYAPAGRQRAVSTCVPRLLKEPE